MVSAPLRLLLSASIRVSESVIATISPEVEASLTKESLIKSVSEVAAVTVTIEISADVATSFNEL